MKITTILSLLLITIALSSIAANLRKQKPVPGLKKLNLDGFRPLDGKSSNSFSFSGLGKTLSEGIRPLGNIEKASAVDKATNTKVDVVGNEAKPHMDLVTQNGVTNVIGDVVFEEGKKGNANLELKVPDPKGGFADIVVDISKDTAGKVTSKGYIKGDKKRRLKVSHKRNAKGELEVIGKIEPVRN